MLPTAPHSPDATGTVPSIEFIDLKRQQHRIRHRLDARLKRLLDSGSYIMGPEVRELEAELAAFVGVRHCITCSNGTDALLMPLMAWGIGPGDAVFVPTFTFFATAEAVSLTGATPVFVDVDRSTFNIDLGSLRTQLEAVRSDGRLTPRAVIPVDLFGQPAPYAELLPFAAREKLFVLEDLAQAFGATWQGLRTGSFGECAATSFFPAKPLGCYGDGGAIFCHDDGLAETLRSIRVHGQGGDRYTNIRIGLNSRLDTIQAAVLLEKLTILPEELLLRAEVAARYHKLLADLVEIPLISSDCTSVWAQYSVLTDNRDRLVRDLGHQGIPVMVYYPTPLHRQRAYADLSPPRVLPVSEWLAKHILSLPMHPYLDRTTQEFIAASVARCVSGYSPRGPEALGQPGPIPPSRLMHSPGEACARSSDPDTRRGGAPDSQRAPF